MTRKSRYEVVVVATVPATEGDDAGDLLWEQIGKILDLSQEVGLDLAGSPFDNNPKYDGDTPNPYRRGSGGPAALQVKVKDEKKLKAEACESALADARAQAERIAEACGVKLGKVRSVRIKTTSPVMPTEKDLSRWQVKVAVDVSYEIE